MLKIVDMFLSIETQDELKWRDQVLFHHVVGPAEIIISSSADATGQLELCVKNAPNADSLEILLDA